MKSRAIVLLGALVLMMASSIWAQQITRDQFRRAEWEMKVRRWQAEKDHRNQGTILDQTDFDAKYWELHYDVTNISGQILTGKSALTNLSNIDGLNSIDYNFTTGMTVDSVLMNGAPVAFTRPSNILRITLDRAYNSGELFTTTVYYHGHPDPSGFGSFTYDSHNGQPVVTTLSEPEGARDWWPCKDQPHDKSDSADVYITCSSSYTGISNGVMVENRDNGDGTHTYHWHISYPITTYLICLAVSNYQSFTDWYVGINGDSMPVTNYVYPELFNQAVEDFNIVPGALGIYASLFGEYPFFREKFGYTLFPWGGGMEHQDNVFYGSMLISGYHYYDWITVHEMSHQWFGDAITCDIWPDIWMNEGFASYCEALYYERMNGYDYYINYMQNSNGVSDPSGPIYNPSQLFDGNTVYNKGAWVLHMLRAVMGDSAFFQGMYAYANDPRYQYGTITTREYQHAMEPFYGDSLGWFFDEWVWGMNRPIYRYSWLKQNIGGNQYEVFLHIRQIQSSPAPNIFTMPIKIYPTINGVDTVITIWNNQRISDYRFIVNGNPSAVSLDKHNWILRDAASEAYRMNIVTPTLADGRVGVAYDDTVEARGGTLPYHFAVYSGHFPSGLTLNSTTGIITGTPSAAEIDTFTIRCTDSSGPALTDDQIYGVTITGPQCHYISGDANGDQVFNGLDVVFDVNYLKGVGQAPPDTCDCPPHGVIYSGADANGDCVFNGIDVSYDVNYLKGIGASPQGCADCPSLP